MKESLGKNKIVTISDRRVLRATGARKKKGGKKRKRERECYLSRKDLRVLVQKPKGKG